MSTSGTESKRQRQVSLNSEQLVGNFVTCTIFFYKKKKTCLVEQHGDAVVYSCIHFYLTLLDIGYWIGSSTPCNLIRSMRWLTEDDEWIHLG